MTRPYTTARHSVGITWGILLALFCACSVAHAQFSVTGGTQHERAVLTGIIQNRLSGLILAGSPVSVRIVSDKQMATLAKQAGFYSEASPKSDNDEVDGLFVDHPPVITLESGIDADPDFRETFVHEWGHYLWAHLLTRSDRGQYQQVYAKQLHMHKLVTNYSEVSVEEGFAEAFAYYILESATLLSRDHGSYRFMRSLVARLRADGAATDNDINYSNRR